MLGCGARAPCSSSSWWSTPSRRRISASASRPVCSIWAAAATARAGSLVEDPARAAGLHDHHADAVGDDVVHLARDPAALLGGGAQRLLRVGVLLALRGLVELLGELGAGAHARGPTSQEMAPNAVGKM